MKKTLFTLILACSTASLSYADTQPTPPPTYQPPAGTGQGTPVRLQPERPINPKRPQDITNLAIYYIVSDGNLFVYSTDSVMGEVIVTTDQGYPELAHDYTDLGGGYSCDISSAESLYLTVIVDGITFRN